jgi:hypothetical protein
MRTLLLASCMILVAGPAGAISRYVSTGMSCARVHDIIRNEGAAIMRYPSRFHPGNILYDRYVADSRFCDAGKAANLTTIPAADRANCPVYNCQDIDYDQPGG